MASIKLSALISRLRDEGVSSVEISYDGSGDSGSIGDVYINRGLKYPSYDAEEHDRLQALFSGELEDFGYHILNNYYHWDWYNNEGGYGNVVIDVATSEVSVEGYVREVADAHESIDIETLDY
jgi:hypothetical protein